MNMKKVFLGWQMDKEHRWRGNELTNGQDEKSLSYTSQKYDTFNEVMLQGWWGNSNSTNIYWVAILPLIMTFISHNHPCVVSLFSDSGDKIAGV